MKLFASDNNSCAHPLVLKKIEEVNRGYVKAYGEDDITAQAIACLKQEFGQHARVNFVFLGTAANVIGLRAMSRSYEGIICPETAHINCDECGAPEVVGGSKLVTVPSHNGKIHLDECLDVLEMREAVHHVYPRVLSITQITECGTAYTVEELQAIGKFCHDHDLFFHMDGARLANAAAGLGVSLRELTTDVGVDVLSFGGTKNGLLYGEAVIFFNHDLERNFRYFCKQYMQLGSKMRFLTAQFIAYMQDGLWRENASKANAAAALLAKSIGHMEHLRIEYPVDGNILFVRMHKESIAQLAKEYYFYVTDKSKAPGCPEDWHLVRFITSFDTEAEDVLQFAEAIGKCAGI